MSEWTEAEPSESSGGTTVSPSVPSNPSKGDQWVDTSYKNPAIKFYDGEKWITASEGDNVPGEKTYTVNDGTDTDTIDVSDVNESVQVTLNGEPGQSGSSSLGGVVWNTSTGGGGSGARAIAEIDLSFYTTLRVECPHNNGSNGSVGGSIEGGDGGDSVALYADGTRLLAAGGGGGGGAGYYSDYGSGNGAVGGGGGGGPNGGRGGSATSSSADSGDDGGVWKKNNSTFNKSVIMVSEEKNNENGGIILFN